MIRHWVWWISLMQSEYRIFEKKIYNSFFNLTFATFPASTTASRAKESFSSKIDVFFAYVKDSISRQMVRPNPSDMVIFVPLIPC